MSKVSIPFVADDISALARSLRRQLADVQAPGHCELLDMLSRAAGFRNFQHYRAQAHAHGALERPDAPSPDVDLGRLRRVARAFDAEGRLSRWPSKLSEQTPCLWVLWSRLPPRESWKEREFNERLIALHGFGDHALLRRELVNHGLVSRPLDCSVYQRIERKPPAEAAALIRHLARSAESGPTA